MQRNWGIVTVLLTAVLYLGIIAWGLHLHHLSLFYPPRLSRHAMAWVAPRHGNIPVGPQGDSIRRGELLFNETPQYAAKYTSSKVSCSNCHAEGGIQPYASPMVGLPALFPMFNQRAGRKISLQDRVEECFVRSENGKPVDYQGTEMQDIVAYIQWLSLPQHDRKPFVGRGLINLPDLKPDPVHGEQIYKEQCAGCHGSHGQGRAPLFPPLWGPYSFNDGAGMNNVNKMAAFVKHNMPQNRMGILSAQQAYDVSAFIHTQPRPAFNRAYQHF